MRTCSACGKEFKPAREFHHLCPSCWGKQAPEPPKPRKPRVRTRAKEVPSESYTLALHDLRGEMRELRERIERIEQDTEKAIKREEKKQWRFR